VTGNHGGVDIWVLKIDTFGNVQWQYCYGGAGYERIGSAIQTTDGGFFITGLSNSTSNEVTGNHGSYDYWVVKLYNNGNIQWEQSYGGTNYDAAGSGIQTTDGGYIVAGISSSNNDEVTGHHGDTTSVDYWVVKIDTVGNIQWEQSYGGSGTDNLHSLIQASEGGFVMVGTSYSNDGDVTGHHGDSTTSDYWVVKIDEYPSGINNINAQQLSQVYPNPTNDHLILNVNSYAVNCDYRLTDMTGRDVLNGMIQTATTNLSLSTLHAGVYLLEINNNGRQVFKLVKQ
jgi:hypothetical protein